MSIPIESHDFPVQSYTFNGECPNNSTINLRLVLKNRSGVLGLLPLFSLADERQDTRKRPPNSREPEPQSRASDYRPAIFSIASSISFNRDSKEKKRLISQPLIQLTVGMTRLELATSRPPDACATNCATSRKRVQRYNVFLKPPNLWGFFCEKLAFFSKQP